MNNCMSNWDKLLAASKVALVLAASAIGSSENAYSPPYKFNYYELCIQLG
jgi:hypothetical protein